MLPGIVLVHPECVPMKQLLVIGMGSGRYNSLWQCEVIKTADGFALQVARPDGVNARIDRLAQRRATLLTLYPDLYIDGSRFDFKENGYRLNFRDKVSLANLHERDFGLDAAEYALDDWIEENLNDPASFT
jgi:hypothetical protein